MSDFKPGDIVDITVKGARVVDISTLGECELGVAYECASGSYGWVFPLGPPEVTVKRVAPPEWPPRIGDLWRDRDGDVWLCRTWQVEGEEGPCLACARRSNGKGGLLGGSFSIERVLARFGPLTLVHREEGP